MVRKYTKTARSRPSTGPPERAVPGVSLKRRAARDAVDVRVEGAEEAAAEAEALVPRKASSMTKDTRQRMRGDSRFTRVSDDDAEDLRRQFESTLVLLDEETGEPREFDTKEPADLAYLAREKNMDVLACKEGVYGQPADVCTGMLRMSKDALPDDLNATGILPLSASQMKFFVRGELNTFADIQVYMPVIPIAVYTPKLLNMLMLGTPTPPTQDSFHLLKVYIAVLQLLRASETTYQRAREAVAWLCGRIEDHTVTREDVARFADAAAFRCAVDDAAAADVLRMSLVQTFDAGALGADKLREFLPHIATVERYEGAGWARVGCVFADDVMEEHAEQGIALCAEVGAVVERAAAADDTDFTAVLGVVQHYTLRFLRLYETSIMRMLEEASKLGDTVPRKYFGDLASPVDRVPEPGEVHLATRAAVRKAREFLTTVRNETMDLGVEVAHNAAAAADTAAADAAHGDCVPTVEELRAYLAFVSYHAGDETVFADSVARMQAVVHVVEPAELIEGISIVDVSLAEAEAEGVAEADGGV